MKRTAKSTRRPLGANKKITENYSYLCRLISYGVVFVLLFFNLLITFFNYYQQAEIKQILQAKYISSQTQKAVEIFKVPEPSPAATSRLPENVVKNLKADFIYGSFGDGFSSLAWINQAETDLFFDNTVTAFSFPPNYSYQKIKDCSSEKECPINPEKKACRDGVCLEVVGNQLFFSNKAIAWPSQEFSGKSRVSISLLEKTWIIGAIIGETQDEKIMVYSFDGKNFSPLLGVNQALRPHYPNTQGYLSFGGVDKDFLVLYLGYDGLAYHFKNGKSEDASKYFGIRVADKGFAPKILRVADGSEVFWYITSATEWKQKFIKLWQNGTDSLEGVISFSGFFFLDWAPQKMSLNYLGKNQEGRDFEFVLDYGPDYPRSRWSFVDQGFDNSIDRKISSGNIITASNQLIGFAKPADFNLNLGFGQQASSSLGSYAAFQFSNNGADWLGANLSEEIIFTDQKGQALYWRARLKKGGNKEYSPFFGNFNNLEYYFRVL